MLNRTVRILSVILFTWSASLIAQEIPSPIPLSPRDFAVQKLKENEFPPEFINRALQNYDETTRNRIVSLNVLGFLSKADYSAHFSKHAVAECSAFMRKYRRTLRKAERRFGVPAELLSALLWVETKYGKVLGRYPLSDVYFSLLQADHPEVVKATLETLKETEPAPSQEVLAKVISRGHTKSDWAMKELRAIDEISRKRHKDLLSIHGSYAGAFGWPQFLPSSYEQWAKSKSGRKKFPDLFKAEDAIMSVASFLKSNGWKRKQPTTYENALFKYNNAQGYVDVIMKIAGCAAPLRKNTFHCPRSNNKDDP